MNALVNLFLITFSFVHRICPLCVISRRFPQSAFAKVVFAWGRICPFCNINRAARNRGLIK